MAFKAKTVSDVVLPIRVEVGASAFTVELRYLTPAHNQKLTEQATVQKLNPESGRVERTLDNDRFSELLFDAIVIRAVDLTPAIVSEMIELATDSDPVPVDAHGHVVERSFLKFLWQEAPAKLFASQVIKSNEAMLQMARMARELDEKNSARSSAP